MALARLYSIRCDSCGKVCRTFAESPRRARAQAKRHDWMSVSRSSFGNHFARIDYCPDCAAKLEAGTE